MDLNARAFISIYWCEIYVCTFEWSILALCFQYIKYRELEPKQREDTRWQDGVARELTWADMSGLCVCLLFSLDSQMFWSLVHISCNINAMCCNYICCLKLFLFCAALLYDCGDLFSCNQTWLGNPWTKWECRQNQLNRTFSIATFPVGTRPCRPSSGTTCGRPMCDTNWTRLCCLAGEM